MLRRRLVSAAILMMAVISLIALDLNYPVRGQRGVWLVPMYVLFTVGTIFEMADLMNRKFPIRPKRIIFYATSMCVISLFPVWYSLAMKVEYPADCPVGRLGWIVIGLLTTSLIAALDAFRTFPSSEAIDSNIQSQQSDIALRWLLTIAMLAYCVGGMSVWWSVRMHGTSNEGMALLVTCFTMIKLADAGAYFVGKKFGRTKLAPFVSPAKTVEGLIGGLLFSVVGAYVAFRIVFPWIHISTGNFVWGPLLFALLLTIVGLIGDLIESLIKRAVGAKDSGSLLPGLGGVWDVTDSMLPTSIVSLLCILAQLT